MDDTSNAIADLFDKQAIYEVVLRYCRGIDRLDYDLIRSAYHPDGIDHHTGFDGPVDEYIQWLRCKIETFDGTMHFVGNHYVELFGDRAISETYSTATHWGGGPAGPAGLNFTSGARFVDLMERRDGMWAISERWAIREWTRSDAGRFIAPEAAGPRTIRGSSDTFHQLRLSLA
ncbi:nuclear transport factor 2 family protein [Prescottella soli]|uniref:Nuclear transport factor 2 family protein n=1 Tax=Prescottella soli TaxID=1543852 RepID=A0ABW9FUD0_9NOCA